MKPITDDETTGKLHKVKGTSKEKTEADGKAKENTGKVQNWIGKVENLVGE